MRIKLQGRPCAGPFFCRAEAALFLASDEAQFVSGVGLNVDGAAIVKF